MKKLNNKGYMLVEIILASVIAFSVAYYLINLTFKFKDQNMDLYNLTVIDNAKINITKNIMEDLKQGISAENTITFEQEGIIPLADGETLATLTNSEICDKSTIKPIRMSCDSVSQKVIFYNCDFDGQIIQTSTELQIKNNNQLIYYAITNDGSDNITRNILYTKTLDNGNEFTRIDCSGYAKRTIKIGITNIYSDEIEYIKLTW